MCKNTKQKYNKTKEVLILDLSSLNPHIRFAKYFENALMHDALRLCYDCHLFYIKEGNCELMVKNQSYTLKNDTVIYIPPGTAYRFLHKNAKPYLTMLIFNFDLISDYAHIKESLGTANESNFNSQKIIKYDLPDEFKNIIIQTSPHLFEKLKMLTNEFLHKDKYYRDASSAIMKACLIEILRKSSITTEFEIIPKLTEYLHIHYKNPELTNEDIAKEFGYHPYYLSQLTKRATGETLHSFLLHYRIRVAKDYLITTDWEINTIAWKCGFNSTSYFIKQFKFKTGVTPYQFRKLNKNTIF